LGAQKPERVKKSFWYSLGISFLITGAIGLFLYLTGEFWIGIIIGKTSTVAIKHAMIRMLHVTLFMFVYAINTILIHALQAFGYPILISVTNILFNLVFRVAWIQFIYPMKPEFATLPLCFTFSWILSMVFYAIFFFFVYRRYIKKGICKKI
jgi:Na+-driven multidrug efflux pump